MEIPRKAWQEYISKLSKINQKAAQIMADWIDANGYDSIENMIAVANGLTQKYGEASAALAAEMYDAIALAQGAAVPAAMPAEVMPSGYVAATVRSTVETSEKTVPMIVGRIVKQAGADTMAQNAQRDNAQFAWIPSGDTCPYCLKIASYGWLDAGKNALKDGHAKHIHSNCDCEYAVRFDGKSEVDGYEPSKYKELLKPAEGETVKDKINSIRVEQYEKNRDKILEQKRIAYRARKEREKNNDNTTP